MDLNQEIKSFVPIDIDKFTQNNKVSEKIVDSIKAYNKAIEYLRTGSEDIAMIELKRVVAINPDFYEAVNLLGLCYAYTNQLDKAEEILGKVVKTENNVLKASEYLNYITSGESGSPRKASRNSRVLTKRQKSEDAPADTAKKQLVEEEVRAEYVLFKKLGEQLKKPAFSIAFNLFGVVCLAAALIFFMLSISKPKENDIKDEPISNTVVNDDLSKSLAQNKELQKQLEAAKNELKQYKLSDEIAQASSLYAQKKYEEAAEKINSIPVNELNENQKQRYDSVKNDVFLKAASTLATQGNTLFNSKKYTEAIAAFEKVFQLGDKWSFGDKALYNLAKSYVEVGDNQKGAATFEKLIEQYPKSAYTKYAKSRLKSIQ